MWEGWLYNSDEQDLNNRLRCIFGNSCDRNQYFTSMSAAMATLCKGPNAFVMDRNPKQVNQGGIFYKTELDTLQNRQLNAADPSDALINKVSKRLTLHPHYLRLTLFFPRSGPSARQMIAFMTCTGIGPSQDRRGLGEVIPCYSAKAETRVELELMFPYLMSAVHYQ